MDIKIRCPHCETKLIVDDDLVGKAVLCEDCNKQFTVEQPAAATASKSGERPKLRERDREEERPRRRRDDDDDDRERSRDDYDDEDDARPVRRKPKRSSSSLAPMIFGSLLVVMTLLVGVGLYFAFGFGASRTTDPRFPGGVPAAGQRFRISAADWQNNGFNVTVETANGQRDMSAVRLAFRSDDGISGSHAFSMAFNHRSTFFVNRPGFGRSRTTLWVETNDFGGGAPLSNTFTLN